MNWAFYQITKKNSGDRLIPHNLGQAKITSNKQVDQKLEYFSLENGPTLYYVC